MKDKIQQRIERRMENIKDEIDIMTNDKHKLSMHSVQQYVELEKYKAQYYILKEQLDYIKEYC